MANIFGAYNDQQANNVSYTANRYTMSGAAPITQEATTASYSYSGLSGAQSQDPWFAHLTKATLAAPADVVDSMAALFGNERGAFNKGLYDTLGMPGFGRWVEENQGSVEVASGLLGSVVVGAGAEMLATKAVTSSWFAATGLGKVMTPLIQNASRAQAIAAEETLLAAKAGKSLGVWEGANRNAMFWAIGTGTAKAAVSEAAIAATLNKNSVIWSDDMGTNIMFGALGLGIGGGLGAITARGSIMRWANSDAVRYERALVADPGGLERGASAIPTMALTGGNPTSLKPSAEITAMAMNSRRVDDPTVAAVTSERAAIQTRTYAGMQERLQRWTRAGTEELPDSKFNKGSAQFTHLEEAIYKDPMAVYGAASVAKLPDDVSLDVALTSHQASIAALAESDIPENIAKAQRLKNQQAMVLIDGQWMPPGEAKIFTETRTNPQDYSIQSGTDQVQWTSRYSGKKFLINENGKVNVNDYTGLAIPDIIGISEGHNRLFTQLKSKKLPFVLTDKAEFYQLDAAIEFEKSGGKVDWGVFKDSDTALVESLKLKSAYLNPPKGNPRLLDDHTRFKLNLPRATMAERMNDPKGAAMRSWLKAADAPGVDIARLKVMRGELQKTLGLTSDLKELDSLSGNLFGFNRERNNPKGKWHEPVIGFFEDKGPSLWHKWELEDDIFETKTHRIRAQGSRKNAPVTATITEAMLAHPSIRAAMDISGLDDSMLGGTTGPIAASAAQTLTQAMRFRNTPALQAAQEIRRVVNRITEGAIDAVFERLQPVLSKLNDVSGAKSKVLYNQYASNSAGWEIASAVEAPDGMIAFALKENSEINASRLGRPVNKGELLTNQKTGKPIVLDDLANEARRAFEKETSALLNERNAVRSGKGLHEIKKRAFFTAPPNTTGKKVGFTLDANNRAVPGGGIVAETDEQFKVMSEALKARLAKSNPTYRFMTKDQIRAFTDLWDEAEIDFIDPTRMAGPSGVNRGALSGEDINPRAIHDILDYLKRGYEENATGALRTVFDTQLGTAHIRSAAQVDAKGLKPQVKNIWQTYEEALLGIPASVNPSGITGLAQEADKAVDAVIAAAWPAMRVGRQTIANALGMLGFVPGAKWFGIGKIKSFDDLATELAPHMPFTSAMDYAQYTKGISVPWTSKDISRALNRLGSAVILRAFELPHAVMNMTGVITNMPGLINNRNVPIVGKVGGVGVVDSMKIMARGFKRMLSERSSLDWDEMVRNGDTTQDVAELHKQMSLITDKSGFMKFVTGDPNGKTWLAKKGLEGAVSIVADTSESMSRRWAHFVGLELADYHGVTGLTARHQFARNIANDVIANYDPLNRPEIYNSGIGSMYGLFLSYAQNYYQRMFRWMEAGDYKALGQSLSMQAAMFGFAGVPGFRQLAALIGESDKDGDGTGDGLMDGIYERWGPQTGSVLAHGTFDQLVTIFGLPSTAMFTRGDANFRHPAGDFLTTGSIPLPAGVEVLKDIVEGVSGVVAGMVNPNEPMSARYAAEIMARTMPSRMIKGTLTVLAAGGQDADANGNVMAETKSVAEAAYRFLGIRSGRQQANIEAYFMNMNSQRVDAARRETLREKTKAMIRSGDLSRLDTVFQGYLDTGGMPWNYASWINDMIQDAPNTRTRNQMLDALKSPGQRELAHRIELFTGGDY